MTGTTRPAVILDISRTVSRASNGNPTGIDRVELAYIRYFLTWPENVHFLARFRKQVVFLDRAGMQAILDMISGELPWKHLDLIGKLSRNKHAAHVESSLRRLAVSWPSMKRGISKIGFTGGVYLNVGHGKLMPKLWDQLQDVPAKKICLVHDVIPLDFPEYCGDKTRERFALEFEAAAKNTDHLIWNSQYTADRAAAWLSKFGIDVPPSTVLHFGTDFPVTAKHSPTGPPNFIAIGTIEPRKNHALLLDIWQDFYDQQQNDSPILHIVGGRGWMNEAVFERLDTAPFMGKTVIEHGYLSDEALAALLANTNGLLFPSFAEGYGFPLVDALVQDIPVICSDIPVFKEIGKTYPIYVNPTDKQSWAEAIARLPTNGTNYAKNSREPLGFVTWKEHFSQLSCILSCLS